MGRKIFTVLLISIALTSCTESKVNRQLPGEWTLVKHSYIDEFGFSTTCDNSSATLTFGNCKKGDCSYSFNYNLPCDNSFDQEEMGTFSIIESGGEILLFRENIDLSIDTILTNIHLITRTDLKIDFYVPTTKRRHLLIFDR